MAAGYPTAHAAGYHKTNQAREARFHHHQSLDGFFVGFLSPSINWKSCAGESWFLSCSSFCMGSASAGSSGSFCSSFFSPPTFCVLCGGGGGGCSSFFVMSPKADSPCGFGSSFFCGCSPEDSFLSVLSFSFWGSSCFCDWSDFF